MEHSQAEPNVPQTYSNIGNLCGNIPSKLSDVVEDQGEQKICRICHGPILGTLKHFIMDCQSVAIERELLWDNLQDQLSLNICASIFNQ